MLAIRFVFAIACDIVHLVCHVACGGMGAALLVIPKEVWEGWCVMLHENGQYDQEKME